MRDMLKFGQLFLQKGKSAGQEIISSSWINKSTSMLIPFDDSQSRGYGYLWWTAKVNGVNIYNALGYAGQFIIIVPSKALVIAATSNSVPVDGYVNDLYDTIMDKIVSSFSVINDK
jgi:CubicO group peptidase (beta-lactamase class C family)